MASNEEIFVDGVPISDLRVVDLKEQLEKRGLSKSGSKTVLAKRLKDQLALENLQKAQAGKDPSAAPNMEMKTSGNDFVAEYLEQQQQMLQAAKLAAARTAAMPGQSPPMSATSSSPDVDNRLGSPPTSKRSRSSRTKSPRLSGGEQGSDPSGADSFYSTPVMAVEKPELESTVVQQILQAETTMTTGVAVAVEQSEMDASVQPKVENSGSEAQQFPEATDTNAATVKTVEETTVTQVIVAEIISDPPPEAGIVSDEGAIETTPPEPKYRSPSPPRITENAPIPPEGNQSRDSTTRDNTDGERTKISPSSIEAEDDTLLSGNDDRGQIDDDSVAIRTTASPTVAVPTFPDDSDEVEMEISAPINAADELLEAVNTALSTTISGGGKRTDEDSVESASSAIEKENRDIPQRKRKWVASTLPKRTALSISSDSLRDIVGSVKDSVKEEDLKPTDGDDAAGPPPKRIIVSREESTVESAADLESEGHQSRRVEIEAARTPAKLTEDGFVRMSSPSPARHPPSNLIHIRGLTRPFTVPALLELLAKYGTFDKEDFWIDNIKSHCIAKFADEASAVLARERLHNIQWPPTNTKPLRVEFATQDDLDRHRSQDGPPGRSNRRNTETDKERPAREVREIRQSDRDDRGRDSTSPRRRDSERDRAWDRGKTWRTGESPPTDPRGAGGRSPERRAGDIKPDQPAPAGKLLDELFRKTKAAPCIYWLPLSLEQIREKERERKKREQERHERVKKMEEEERERDRRRDTYRHRSPVDCRSRRR